ncbi:unnamed protein product [Miscanthus lutarioriparius]|uniref:Phytocyanin domain-containing protein n=1 Tax=Miscanthus lutarioriparius TaxID=422564 RepID=A0A811N3J8_9POAL|nr:unnamed protein product [Miscanthus lutarioriparius]
MDCRKTLLVAAGMATIAAAAALLPTTASAATYTVGDGSGWDVAIDYDAWASGKKFKVGDTLVFRYNAGQDVVVVDEQSYNDCATPNNAPVLTSGNAVAVKLGQSGKYFFICDAEGECASGMKVAINVH